MTGKKLTEEQIRYLFQQYCGGVMLKDLARANGLNRKTLSTAFARFGLRKTDVPGAVACRKPRTRTVTNQTSERDSESGCPGDCKFLMFLNGKSEKNKTMHWGYILFPENGSRGCDPGPGCTRYEPKERK